MIAFETLRAYEGPPAWNEHYHMVPLEVNIDSHYFKRLQTLQVFCNNVYCLIRTVSKLTHSAC